MEVVVLSKAELQALLEQAAKQAAGEVLAAVAREPAPLADVKAVAKRFGFTSTQPIYERVRRGELKALRLGDALRFTEEQIQEYLASCPVDGGHQRAQEGSAL